MVSFKNSGMASVLSRGFKRASNQRATSVHGWLTVLVTGRPAIPRGSVGSGLCAFGSKQKMPSLVLLALGRRYSANSGVMWSPSNNWVMHQATLFSPSVSGFVVRAV